MSARNVSHDDIDRLLPWYVNDTLDAVEREQVERHVGQCAECRGNVEFLSMLGDAVRSDSPSPLVPKADADKLLAAVAVAETRQSRKKSVPVWAIAASIAAAAILVAVFVQRDSLVTEAPQRFETATSPSQAAVTYVVEVTFADRSTRAERQAALADLGAAAAPDSIIAATLTTHVSAGSLSQLQARIDEARALPQVVAADIVAVHLPVE